MFFTCINLVKLPFYIHLSMVNSSSLIHSLALLPLSVFGIFIGYRLLKVIKESIFYNAIYTLIFEEQGSLDIDLELKSAKKSQKAHKHKHGHGHNHNHDH